MAPSRRKGANKASAAAALRKWKVGDLVLAKVKGFPAWPAEVSQPEKWGYPADLKKVVVHFFGTQQIAFCNPADLEEFTEEKKASLLGKRHGKGADFVRAVKEIADSFEKLKHEQACSAKSTDETDIKTENNSEESLIKSSENGMSVVDRLSTGTTNDEKSLNEATVPAAAKDAFRDQEMHVETPKPTSCLTRSKRNIGRRSRNSGSRWSKSAQRLRTSSRTDTTRLEKIASAPVNTSRSSRRLGAKTSDRKFVRKSRRIMKLSESEGQEVHTLASVSNNSTEDSVSEQMAVDSDTPSINDSKTIDPGSKPVYPEPTSENIVGKTHVTDNIDYKTDILMRRIPDPNRSNTGAETTKLEVVTLDTEVLECKCVSPSSSEKSATQKISKDDSDEHLPFAKRARVRMGRPSPSPTVKDEDSLVQKEKKVSDVPVDLSMHSSEPLSYKVDVSTDRESDPLIDNVRNSSLSHASPTITPRSWESSKKFLDGEAALPPSKRLHRALEAMCANAVEDCERASRLSPAAEVQSSESSERSVGKGVVIESKSRSVIDQSMGDPQSSVPEFCAMPTMKLSASDAKNNLVVSESGKNFCMDSANIEMSQESFEHAEGDDNKRLKISSDDVPTEICTGDCVKPSSPGLTENITDHCMIECAELNGAVKGLHSNISQMNSNSVFVGEVSVDSPNMRNGILLHSTDGEGGEEHTRKHLFLANKNQSIRTSELAEEEIPVSLDSNLMPSGTPAKVLTGGHHQYPLHSSSASYDHMDDRTVSVTHSSSSPTDGPDSVARASPPSSSICNVTVSDNANNNFENNSSCSPSVHVHLGKARLASKSRSKWQSLSSFEAIIRSLTRTKESIGRGTRIAIECAKAGLASKVVDILVHSLENESSSHKKVDLFFLVDSITQCSRGMKGDGGIYPSTIQALLPRLLLAAAPPGSSSHENHRQCLKVLKVWQERKILPEPIIRHHIQQLDVLCGSVSYPAVSSRRSLRNERAFDDPIREMEGMQVDEYGSNASIQIPGFVLPPILRSEDGGSESDGESFEAVTPEHNVGNFGGEKTPVHAVEKRSHILEDVDGELEMEDVAPCCDVERSNIVGADGIQMSHNQSNNQHTGAFTPQPSKDVLLTGGPLSVSPLPPHSSLPPSVSLPAMHSSFSNGHDLKPCSSSQNFSSNLQEPLANQSILPRVNSTPVDDANYCANGNKEFEAQLPTNLIPDSTNACSFSNHPPSNLCAPASNNVQRTDSFGKGFHLRPPHPAPSNQFSYVQEPRMQPGRDIPPPPQPNRFPPCNGENGNFYGDNRNTFVPRDNIGECWRPPFPAISGPCYPDGPRMGHPPMYHGPPCNPALPNNQWNFPPPPMNLRHFNPYRPPNGPIPVENRGPHFWRPR